MALNRFPVRIGFLLTCLAAAGSLQAQITPPAAPEIIRVSVDTSTGKAGIQWEASPSPDVEKYTVYYFIPGIDGAIAADTVDRETREYIYRSLDPSVIPLKLTVAAIDSLGTAGVLPDVPHQTMLLSTYYDSCTQTMELDWSSYVGWEKVVRYEVYYSVDMGPFQQLEDLTTIDTSASHINIDLNRLYRYFIQAYKGGAINTYSFSNISSLNVSQPLHPDWINAESASAAGDDSVEVKFAMDSAGEVSNYRLYRASGPGKPFEAVQTFSDVGHTLVYRDPVLSTELSYRYKLYSLDVCNNPVTGSNICGNIVLNARGDGLIAKLQWSPYVEYEAGLDEYLVYRSINRETPEIIGGVLSSDTIYDDDLSFVSGQQIEDKICYLIEAVEKEGFTRGERGFSRSNLACISVKPEIKMANALTPNGDGKNDYIQPVLTFIPKLYIFRVFDRWGSLVFETKDHDIPWRGEINGGKKAPEGVYIYYVKLTTSSGIEVEDWGQITVLYP